MNNRRVSHGAPRGRGAAIRDQYAQQARLHSHASGSVTFIKCAGAHNTGATDLKHKMITAQFNKTANKWETYKQQLDELPQDIENAEFQWSQRFPKFFQFRECYKTNRPNRLNARRHLADLLQTSYGINDHSFGPLIHKMRNNVLHGESSMSLHDISSNCTNIAKNLDDQMDLRKRALNVVSGQTEELHY